MKKLIFLSALAFVFIASCVSENENLLEQTVIVEVFWIDSLGVKTESTGSLALLFEYDDFDFEASCQSIFTGRVMMLANGEFVRYRYHSAQEDGHVHVLERIGNGKYCIVVFFNIGDNLCIGYRIVLIDRDMHNTPIRFIFTEDDQNAFLSLVE